MKYILNRGKIRLHDRTLTAVSGEIWLSEKAASALAETDPLEIQMNHWDWY